MSLLLHNSCGTFRRMTDKPKRRLGHPSNTLESISETRTGPPSGNALNHRGAAAHLALHQKIDQSYKIEGGPLS
jgi:hypothetical protein